MISLREFSTSLGAEVRRRFTLKVFFPVFSRVPFYLCEVRISIVTQTNRFYRARNRRGCHFTRSRKFREADSLLKSCTLSVLQSSESLLSAIFEKVIIIMVVYFIVSIVNSMAQSYHKRLHRPKGRKVAKD